MISFYLFIFSSLYSCGPKGSNHQPWGRCFYLSALLENIKISSKQRCCNAPRRECYRNKFIQLISNSYWLLKCNIFTHIKLSEHLFTKGHEDWLHFDQIITPSVTAAPHPRLPVISSEWLKVLSPNSDIRVTGEFCSNGDVVHLSQTFVLTVVPACFTYLSIGKNKPSVVWASKRGFDKI